MVPPTTEVSIDFMFCRHIGHVPCEYLILEIHSMQKPSWPHGCTQAVGGLSKQMEHSSSRSSRSQMDKQGGAAGLASVNLFAMIWWRRRVMRGDALMTCMVFAMLISNVPRPEAPSSIRHLPDNFSSFRSILAPKNCRRDLSA